MRRLRFAGATARSLPLCPGPPLTAALSSSRC